ncbi:ComF family protein [Paramicrobacterium sp. CJ85]|uniref:ComF family protein n=1 Tax=Paramicrobacterium sp. CJ85 TaxID=3445355 RepID=UPI003F5FDD79
MGRHAGDGWQRSLIRHCRDLLWRAAGEAADFIVPVQCTGCGADGAGVCGACSALLTSGTVHRRVSGVDVFSSALYEGRVKRMLLALKRDGRTDAAVALGRGLRRAVDAVLEHSTGADIELAPVPGTYRSRVARGFAPVSLVLRRAELSGARVLRWRRRPADQIGLSVHERRTNLTGTLRALPRAAGRRFIVIDDVVTSGATLAECVRALREQGAEVVACATVASTPLRGADRRGSSRATPERNEG